VKVTLNATEADEPIRKHFNNVLHWAGQKAALNSRPRFV
jgi:hypothetical protein